jgi:hypothetical protein
MKRDASTSDSFNGSDHLTLMLLITFPILLPTMSGSAFVAVAL